MYFHFTCVFSSKTGAEKLHSGHTHTGQNMTKLNMRGKRKKVLANKEKKFLINARRTIMESPWLTWCAPGWKPGRRTTEGKLPKPVQWGSGRGLHSRDLWPSDSENIRWNNETRERWVSDLAKNTLFRLNEHFHLCISVSEKHPLSG